MRAQFILSLSVITILFISSGIMQVLEGQFGSQKLPLHDWLYFVIVLTSGASRLQHARH